MSSHDELVSWVAAQVQKRGAVFRIPAVRPTYVISGREALNVLDDADLVERTPASLSPLPPLFKTLCDDKVAVLGMTSGADHTRRRASWVVPGGLSHTGLAKALPILNKIIGNTLSQWDKLALFSLNLEVRRACWRIATQLVLGKETDEQHLADFEISMAINEQGDRVAAKKRILDWIEQEAAHFESAKSETESCLAARFVQFGLLSRPELVNEIKHGLISISGLSFPITEIFRHLATDSALLATLRAEVSALGANFSPSGMAKTPGLRNFILNTLKRTTPLPMFSGQTKKAFTVAGVKIPAGAVVIGALHATVQMPPDPDTLALEKNGQPSLVFGSGRHVCPGADLSLLTIWLFAAKFLADYDIAVLDPTDLPFRQTKGYLAPRGSFVHCSRIGRSVVVPPAPSTSPPLPAPEASASTTLARSTRIAIIGGGITGITCAHALRKSGFTNVTVFERAASIGGKADTVEIEGRLYNLGAHLCNGHLGVGGLAQEVGVSMERVPNYVLWDIDQNQAIERSYESNAAVKKLHRMYALNRQMAHDSGFASAEPWAYAPISKWLDAHDLGALREIGPFFTGAGYGFLEDDLPAAFFLTFARDMNEEGFTPSGGYKHLLERVSAGLDVRCSTEVIKIERKNIASSTESSDAATIHITSRRGHGGNPAPLSTAEDLCHEQFDRVILTGPLEHAESYLDVSPEEQTLFRRIKSHDYYTVLATLDIEKAHEPGLYIVPKHTASSSLKGHTTAFARIFAESKVYHFYCYGKPGQTEASILENVRADIKKLGAELRHVHVCRKWAYAPQVSPHDMALGFHRRMERMQGQLGTYYAGSLLAFELTDHNVLFAQNLIQRHFAAHIAKAEEPQAKPQIDPHARVPEHGTQSLLDIVRERYEHTPDALFTTFLDAKGKEVRTLSYKALVERAMACAASLRAKGAKPGDRVALVYPPDTDEFLIGFLGCLCADTIAVPVACPDPRKLDVEVPRFARLMHDCDCRFALTTRVYYAIALAGRAWNRLTNLGSGNKVHWPDLIWISTDGLSPLAPNPRMPIPSPRADTIAYLQYTSGSTSAPKGVMITHGNVLHNVEAIRVQTKVSKTSVLLGWVPLFHDMGLVGGALTALSCGAHLVFFSPISFLQNPQLWLKAIHQYRATHTESPNFGYEFLLRHLDDQSLQGLDLSCLTHVLFGGEAMRHRTFERMATRLHSTGFRAQAMTNIFGAAEATLFLAGGGLESTPLLSVSTHALESKRRAIAQNPDLLSTTTYLGCGLPPAPFDLRIVDADTRRLLPDGEVGEIWLASPSVSPGYWGRTPEQNAAIFQARIADDPAPLHTYLRTGDLGFIERDILYICGRLKEMMIFSGRNIHPTDIESCVMNAHTAIRQGCVAAFSVEEQEQEKLVIVAELKTKATNAPSAAAAIAHALLEHHNLSCKAVILVASGSLPKTSSGKLQRYRAREDYLASKLQVIHAQREDQAQQTDLSATNTAEEPNPIEQSLFDEVFQNDVCATRKWLQRLVALFLHVHPEQISCETPLALLGVDSAQALMITSRIGKYLGREIAPSVLYEHATIDSLALFLCTHAANPDQGLVRLQHGDPNQFPRLFCTHPAGGNPMAYLGLVQALPGTIPVYAFGNENSALPAKDLIAMAQGYVAEMQTIQPSGPYYLVGYSLGGCIAYEMARQVLAAGGRIACIFMIDAPAPLYNEDALGPKAVEMNTYGGLLETAIINHLIPDQLDDEDRAKMLTRIDSNQRALVAYRIGSHSGVEPRIIMFRASAEAAHLRDSTRHPAFDRPDFGWEEAAPGSVVEVAYVSGDHFSVMNEPILLAEMLVARLAGGLLVP